MVPLFQGSPLCPDKKVSFGPSVFTVCCVAKLQLESGLEGGWWSVEVNNQPELQGDC